MIVGTGDLGAKGTPYIGVFEMTIQNSVVILSLPFFIYLDDDLYEIPLDNDLCVKIKTIARLPIQPDERYIQYAKSNIVTLRDRYGRSRYTELEIYFPFDDEQYSATDNQLVFWDIILPAMPIVFLQSQQLLQVLLVFLV